MKHYKSTIIAAMVSALAASSAYAQSDSYEVGYTADLTGVAASTYAPWAEGVRVYVEYINSKGGVNGHKVNLTIRDNKSDAALVAQDARLFSNDAKYPLVFFSATSATVTPYLNAGGSNAPTVYGNVCYPPSTPPKPAPAFFCAFGTRETLHKAFVDEMPRIQKQPIKLGLMAADLPGTVQSTKIMGAHAEKNGAKIVLFQAVPLSMTDFTAIARKFIDAKANVILNYNFTSQNIGLAQALVKLGYKGIYMTDASLPGGYEPLARLKSPNIVALDVYAAPSEKLPVHAQIESAAKQFGSRYPVSDLRVGWAMGIAMKTAFEKCGFPCSREKLLPIMSNLTVDTPEFKQLNGGVMQWTPDNHVGVTKGFRFDAYNAKTGQFEPVEKAWQYLNAKDLIEYDHIQIK
jgi:ABC-type branched-subunit amino acid transport system substrate-binding protein